MHHVSLRSRAYPFIALRLSAIALAVAATVSLSACGGGGGGGGPLLNQTPPPDLYTQPPPLQPAPMNHAGIEAFLPAESVKVNVGVVDTGFILTHHAIAASVSGSRNFSTTTPLIDDVPSNNASQWHGTPVTQVLARGTHNEALWLARPQEDGVGFAINSVADAGIWANAQGARLVNYSLSNMFMRHADTDRLYTDHVARGSAAVIAAGNENRSITQTLITLGTYGTPAPSIFEHAPFAHITLVVGALSPDNVTLAPFSNRPGERTDVQARFLVTQSQTEVYSANSTAANPVREWVDGTSFATPVVSAALTTVIARWPHLTPDLSTSLLLDTADRDFSPLFTQNNCGPSANVNCGAYHFGRGRLNLMRALQPVGPVSVPTGANVGQGVAIEATHLRLPAAFGDASPAGVTSAVFDSFGRDFALPVAALVQRNAASDARRNFLSQMEAREVTQSAPVGGEQGAALNVRLGFAGDSRAPVLTEFGFASDNWRMSLASMQRAHQRLPSAGLHSAALPQMLSFADHGALQAFDGAHALGAAFSLSDGVEVYAQFNQAHMTGRGKERGAQDQSAVLSAFGLNFTPLAGLSLGVGVESVQERGGVQGAQGAGALALTASSAQSVVLRFNQDLGAGWRGFGLLRSGTLDVQGQHLLASVEGARTSEFAAGVAFAGQRSQMFLALSQPLRVDSARAHFNAAVGRTLDG
ncbi:MAG: S8 family serine peptidase [Pseudomonadota bacterium]|jgi:hypothetical protein